MERGAIFPVIRPQSLYLRHFPEGFVTSKKVAPDVGLSRLRPSLRVCLLSTTAGSAIARAFEPEGSSLAGLSYDATRHARHGSTWTPHFRRIRPTQNLLNSMSQRDENFDAARALIGQVQSLTSLADGNGGKVPSL